MIAVTDQATQLIMLTAMTNMVNQLRDPLKALFAALVFPPEGEGKEAMIMEQAVKLMRPETEEMVSKLPPDNRTAFETRLNSLENSVRTNRYGGSFTVSAEHLKTEFDKLVYTLSLPSLTTDVYQHGIGGDPRRAAARDELQAALANSFDEPARSQLDTFMCLGRHFFLRTDTPRMPVMLLQGPPGTGKTYFTRKVAEKILDAVLIELSMMDLAAYLGNTEIYRLDNRGADQTSVLDSFGKAWRQIIEDIPTRNVVFFIDEVDFETNHQHQKMLKPIQIWLNPDNPDLPVLRQLKVAPKIRGPVVFATNHGLDRVKFKPFADRLSDTIRFPHWSREKLVDRANEHFDKETEALKGIHRQASIDAVQTAGSALLPLIVDHSMKYPPDIVTLRDIQRVIEETILKIVIAADMSRPIDPEKIEADIAQKFKDISVMDIAQGGVPQPGNTQSRDAGRVLDANAPAKPNDLKELRQRRLASLSP
jgi:hypothetical protein